jgi:uncharacterized membrane protein
MIVYADTAVKKALRWCLASLYATAGVLHLVIPEPFLSITPGSVPAPATVVFATGVCEIAGAAGLLLRPFRMLAGTALALYAICVFPANINHALQDLGTGNSTGLLGWWYHVPRLLVQPLLVWASLYSSGVSSWPILADR